jgi:hypothetical protein
MKDWVCYRGSDTWPGVGGGNHIKPCVWLQNFAGISSAIEETSMSIFIWPNQDNVSTASVMKTFVCVNCGSYVPITHHPDDEYIWNSSEMILTGKKWRTREKNLSQCHYFPTQIPYNLPLARTRASVSRSRRLTTTWSMAWPVWCRGSETAQMYFTLEFSFQVACNVCSMLTGE